ncbi:MAG: hypothetical protein GXY41_05165 [Phycisphaerae bacterium]|nr:hypothetical protein [Phycisphaerae bacterium]
MKTIIHRKKTLSAILFVAGILCGTASAASSVRFLLTADETLLPKTLPLSLDLEGITIAETQTPRLYRIEGDQKIALASQMEIGRTARLWYAMDKTLEKGQRVTLELVIGDADPSPSPLNAVVDDTTITLRHRETPILSYHHAVHPVPEGVNPIFERSGFIHPLYTPDGMVVTRIQPSDHYHHYGIWSPWTQTLIEGRAVDFWNLASGQGRVRFAGLMSTTDGSVYSGFKVHQEHVMYIGRDRTEKIAMNEVWDIRAAAMELDGRTVWVVDYTSTLSNALDSAIELSAYRYGGGLGFRATDDWNRQNLRVLTSEGQTRNAADGTRARWADIRGVGRNKSGTSGVLFFSHISNREHPEPMRVWPDNTTGEGFMFFDFCPIRHNAWVLSPNREYVLRYRMLVYDGTIAPETAEMLWKHFAQPPMPVRAE